MYRQPNQKNPDRGVSETIGAVMLVSVVVVAVAIVGVVLTSQGTPQNIPALDAVISNYGNTIQIYHNGGDTLQKDQIKIYVDGAEPTFRKGGTDAGWTFWSPGDSLVTDMVSTPKVVTIVYDSGSGGVTVLKRADFTPSGMNNPGPIVTDTLKAEFSASPASGSPPLVVHFTDLSTGYPVGWSWNFGDGTSIETNPTHVYNNAGSYSVTLTVTNSTGSTDFISHPVTVSATAPSVISISPVSGARGTNNIPVNVYGTGFVNGATIKLQKTGDLDIGIASVVFGSSTTLSGTLSLPSGATIGSWNVVVTNPDAQAGTLTNGFTITDPAGAPTVLSITPATGVSGTEVTISNLAGTNFQTGAQVKVNGTGYPDIFAGNVVIVSPSKITCTIPLSGATAGARNIVVTNTDGQTGVSAPGIFTVTAAPAAPVTADFTGTPTSGNIPLTVQFVDTSTGSPTTWSWNFGDSGTSTLQNPSHQYLTANTYTVSLTVGNGTGKYNTKTRTGYITANTPVAPLSFYDNFDTGFTGWTTSGTVTRITSEPRNGIASIRLQRTSDMQQPISTAGNTDITVSYYFGVSTSIDNGEYIVAEWYDGATWHELGRIENGDAEEDGLLHYHQYSLPAAANNPSFALRFSLNANSNNEYGYVDDVRVTGIPL